MFPCVTSNCLTFLPKNHISFLRVGTLFSNIIINININISFPGVGILYKKTPPPPPNLFSFIEPFSLDVWIYMTTAYLGASLTMFLLAR